MDLLLFVISLDGVSQAESQEYWSIGWKKKTHAAKEGTGKLHVGMPEQERNPKPCYYEKTVLQATPVCVLACRHPIVETETRNPHY